MGHVISFLNEKGGVGKTSLCFNVGWNLADQGKKILLIDLDGQSSNLTFFTGVHNKESLGSLYDFFLDSKKLGDIVENIKENLYIIPANDDIISLNQDNAPLQKLKPLIGFLKEKFDFIFLDVNPTPGRSHALALSVCEHLIIPLLPDVASLRANIGIVESVNMIHEKINPSLNILGFVFNKWDNRTILGKETLNTVRKMADDLDCIIFNTLIRQNVSLSENVGKHQGITDYMPGSNGADDIRALTLEIVKELKNYE